MHHQKILEIIERLQKRINERFPHHGISRVVRELHSAVLESTQVIAEFSRPNLWLRLGIVSLVGLIIVFSINGLISLEFSNQKFDPTELITLLEAGI